MDRPKLYGVAFDLFYLSKLTNEGVKPLSRWEGDVGKEAIKLLKSHGLRFAVVDRFLLPGAKIQEIVFSRSAKLIDQYRSHFDKKVIDKSAASKRLEGQFFGYPVCCIEQFIEHPYQPNSLSSADQRLLFHWACPHCSVTPLLLPDYRRVHEQCLHTYRTEIWHRQQKEPILRKAFAVAASVSLLTLTTIGCSRDFFFKPQPYKPDVHLLRLPAEVDGDQDFLEDRLERILSLNHTKMDTDNDGIPDGPDMAQQLWLIYRTLPDQPRLNAPYVEHHLMRGLETCNVCNQTVNMGYAILFNPLENLSLEAPYIFLHHFFEHGSFSYDGSLHENGRINAALFKIVLSSDGSSHWLGDTYSNAEVEEFRMIAAKIDSLPRSEQTDSLYVIDHQMKGIEMCHCCGEYFNMGYLAVVNPKKKQSYDLPYIGLHFLRCGSKKYEGDHNTGMVDISMIKTVIE